MRAAITGWALRTPLGNTVTEVADRLLAGERAARPNPQYDASRYACGLAAVCAGPARADRSRRHLRRAGLLGMEAAAEAMAQAAPARGERLGLFVGVGGLRAHWEDLMPAFERQAESGERAWEHGLGGLHPFWMLHHLSNNAHALLSMEFEARGEGLTLGGANAGAQALSAALRTLEAGAIDAALVVAYDTLLEPETLLGLGEVGALSRATLAELASPYDMASAGFIPGEGAGALVLQRPGAPALALLDAADGADGQPGPASPEALLRLARALGQPGDAVDGAGLGRPAFDAREREMLAGVVGEGAPLTATSAAWGQLGAATALVQAAALGECLRRGQLPPIAALRTPASGPLRPLTRAEGAGRAVLALSAGAPGLAGAIRVEVA